MSASLVNNKFRITRRIGGGSFGEIYLGIGPSGEKVAVKFERHGTKCPQLRHEYKVYREMQNCHGFCNVSFIFKLFYFHCIQSVTCLCYISIVFSILLVNRCIISECKIITM